VTGLVLAYILYIVHEIFTSFALMGKDNEIKKNKDELLGLAKRVHQLELENEKLKHSCDIEAKDTNAL
jgi:cell shape-determining protein MreC